MEVNEAKLIEREITLRELRLTKEVVETRRSMVRWLALSLGVINPGESRLSAISVLDSMLYFQFTKNEDPTVEELSKYIGEAWAPINEKTLRYHLLQLANAGVLSHSKGKYRFIIPDGYDRYDIDAWVENYFESGIYPIKGKVSTVIKELSKR
ncbi:MAG: hypothetical protein M1128_01400 [Candidatus Marsarchaeota archaeon]|nr:hypothetical protein [Candidatus Marsarchaeota archaeon]